MNVCSSRAYIMPMGLMPSVRDSMRWPKQVTKLWATTQKNLLNEQES